MNIFFGTDGWRAHIDTEINQETVSVVAQAFADFIHNNYKEEFPRVALAYDTRKNSQLFARIFAEVLSGNHIEALLSDRHHSDTGIILCYFAYRLLCRSDDYRFT